MNNIGWDLLGLLHPRFPVDRAIRFFPASAPLGFQHNRFGTNLDPVKKFLDSGKVSLIRCHFIWDGHKNLPLTKAEAKVIAKSAKDVANAVLPYRIPLYLSPYLEHSRKESVYKGACDIILDEAPAAKLVNCPMSGWAGSYRGSKREAHGPNGRAEANSLDGVSLFDISLDTRNNWRRKTASYTYRFAWCWQFNGRKSASDNTPPEKRRNFPTDPEFRKVVRLVKS